MSSKRLRQDLDHATSVLLLLSVVAAIATGFIAHVWDLNDFSWHTWSGYAMAGLAVAHVALNLDRLVSYWRFRSRQGARALRARMTGGDAVPARSRVAVAANGARAGPPRQRPGSVTRRVLLTSAATTVGALGGWAAARRISTVDDPVGNDAGMVYHRLSRPGVADAIDSVVLWGREPAPAKTFPDAAVVALPALAAGSATTATESATVPLATAVLQRTSVRDYADRPLTLDELGAVLFMTAGRRSPGRRTFPSSGALYPIEVYAVVNSVEGLERGLYHYDPERNALHVLRRADLRDRIARDGLGQSFLGAAGVVLCLTVIPDRMRFRYRHRSYRYGLLEAGHLGQNTYLAATAMGLGACAVGAFFDDSLNDLIGVDGRNEAVVYVLSVGAVNV